MQGVYYRANGVCWQRMFGNSSGEIFPFFISASCKDEVISGGLASVTAGKNRTPHCIAFTAKVFPCVALVMCSVVEFTNVCVYSCVAGSVDEVDVRVSHIHMSYTCVFGIGIYIL